MFESDEFRMFPGKKECMSIKINAEKILKIEKTIVSLFKTVVH